MVKQEKRLLSQRATAVVGMSLILLVVVIFFIFKQNTQESTTNKKSETTNQTNVINTNAQTKTEDTKTTQTNTQNTPKPTQTVQQTYPELPVDDVTMAVKNLYTWDGTRSSKTFQIFDCSNGPEGMFATPKLSLSGYQIQTINMSGVEYRAFKIRDFLTNLGWSQDQCNNADMPGHIYVMTKDGKNALVEEVTGDGDNSWKVKISYEI